VRINQPNTLLNEKPLLLRVVTTYSSLPNSVVIGIKSKFTENREDKLCVHKHASLITKKTRQELVIQAMEIKMNFTWSRSIFLHILSA